jgi:outer membrane protein OmpA-like peptidoglycan-associated protein
MRASALHSKRPRYVAAFALAALRAPLVQAADPTFLPEIAPLSDFPDPSRATRREGVFLPPGTVHLLTPGMNKHQAYAILGAPHFHEGFFGERQWDYILNFYTGSGTEYRICRLQLRWNGHMRLDRIAWSAEKCRAAVYPVVQKAEAAVPAPPPAPALPPVPRLAVYFDFEKANLSETAREELAAFAASAATANQPLSIIGYTDSAGPGPYNDRLSLMRADAVAKALLALGLPAARLQISGAGKRSPAVETADGKAEPMNRRAVITIAHGN